jgi:hypothetical protein
MAQEKDSAEEHGAGDVPVLLLGSFLVENRLLRNNAESALGDDCKDHVARAGDGVNKWEILIFLAADNSRKIF